MTANISKLETLLAEGVTSGVFPSAQAHVLHEGRTVFTHAVGGATEASIFDLASLTKVMCTGALMMKAWGTGKLGPETPVQRLFPESGAGKSGATVADLLFHRSGLPAWVPYFMPVLRAVPELRAVDCPARVRLEVRYETAQAVKASGVVTKKEDRRAVYSDVGFIVLGELLAEVLGGPLDALYEEHVAKPLGLSAKFHRLSTWKPEFQNALATGDRRPRPAASGQEGGWEALGWLDSRTGEVDDDNAWVLDGVAGHAGLFGTATDVARFGQGVLEELGGASKLAPSLLWERALKRDTTIEGSTRALAFDTPSLSLEEYSSAGKHMAASGEKTFGHLGFTGTSLWVDRTRNLVVALCSNRTLPGRTNNAIREFRPRFHDAVVEALGL